MGTYLSTPVTDKCEESGEAPAGSGDRPVEWGVVDMQGWRKSMEDAHTAVTSVPMKSTSESDRDARVFGVYDGHGGPEVARFCQHYFVSVLTNQENWIENLPLEGDDKRVPSAPPQPNNNPYDGNGNELAYRSSHLPVAMETPVGKALRQAFHAMDRMIDDPSRRNEIVTLRTVKPEKGATKTLENGIKSVPPIPDAATVESPPDFYIQSQPAASLATAATEVTTAEENTVVSPSVGLEPGPEMQQQADRSLSVAMNPEQAEALKDALEEFEKNSDDDTEKTNEEESVNSNEPVGQEEAAALDDNIDEPSTDADATTETPAEGSPNGGKVTTMLQKILSLGGSPDAADAGASESASGENKDHNQPANVVTAEALVEAPKYPESTEVSGTSPRYPTVSHNGRLVCNLPDHPIHAGATAVVAVITGNILTVANAGDSRAVLCRRKSSDDEAKGHYAYPMSYDHKPSQAHEMNRILRSGGFVNHFGRINGNLNLSRSIGDLKYKQVPGIPPAHQMITAEPDIMQIALQEDDEFFVLGCDGIWDCLSNEQAVDFVMSRIDTNSLTEIGAEMLDQIISDDPRVTQGIGGDNMTVMIVDLKSSTRSRKAAGAPATGEDATSGIETAETSPAQADSDMS